MDHLRGVRRAPGRVLVAARLDVEDALTMGEGEWLIEGLEARLKGRMPELASIYVRPETAAMAEVARPEALAGGETTWLILTRMTVGCASAHHG